MTLRLRPFALALHHFRLEAAQRPAAPETRRTPLLPLGAMLTGLALPGLTLAQDDTTAEAPAVTATAPAAAASGEATLPTVNVTTDAEAELPRYQGGTTRVGKVQQLAKDIPQSLTIVPEALITDRNAYTLKEALRNVAGLTFNAGEGGRVGDNITIRGYSAVGDLYLDGMRDIAQYNRETFNLEQIDVLRGSSSMLFGRGSTGGIINQVSKLPQDKTHYKAAITGGTDQYLRFTADVNESLSPTAAVRLTAMSTQSDSTRNAVNYERYGFAPSIRLGMGTANEVYASYYKLTDDNLPDFGVPYFNGKPLDVPVDTFYGLANADYERNDTGIATVGYVHTFAPDTTLRTVLRRSDYNRDLQATAPRLAGGTSSISDDTVMNRQRQARGSVEDTITSQTDFNTRRVLFGLSHELLAGMELVKERATRYSYSNPVSNPSTTVGNPDPNPTLPANYFDGITRTNFNSYEASTLGLYAQDVLSLAPHWKLMLGLRWDAFRSDYDRPEPAGDLERNDYQWSHRSGVLYQPTDLSSYYIAYGSSYNPSGELYQLDDRSSNTPPEKSRNIEAGAKWELLEGDLSLRAALFRSEKTNERNTDLATPDIFLLTGKRHTDGIELEAAGRVTRAWEVFATVSYLDAKVDKASFQQANNEGKRPVNTPDYTSSLWTTYQLTPHWKIGGGVEAIGKRQANDNNSNSVDAYTRWDAIVSYEVKHYGVRLNVFNLFDEEYYEGVYRGHAVPGTTRAAQLTTEFKF
jgi:catecholate siderophore receptor